jgi:hypothetical protein
MEEPQIRVATAADVPAIEEIVNQAYRHYVTRIGKPPGPMLEDYAARVSEGAACVLEDRAATVAIIVLKPEPDYLLLDSSPTACRTPLRFAASRIRAASSVLRPSGHSQ